MRLDYALLAHAAEFSPDGRLYLLGGDIDTVNATALPVYFPQLFIVLRFAMESTDSMETRMVNVVPLDPDGNPTRGPMQMALVPNPSHSIEQRLGLSLRVLHPHFDALGDYVFRIDMDGVEIGRIPLRIRHIQIGA